MGNRKCTQRWGIIKVYNDWPYIKNIQIDHKKYIKMGNRKIIQ